MTNKEIDSAILSIVAVGSMEEFDICYCFDDDIHMKVNDRICELNEETRYNYAVLVSYIGFPDYSAFFELRK